MIMHTAAKTAAIIISDGNVTNLINNVFNILKQSFFKCGMLDLFVFYKNEQEKEKLESIFKHISFGNVFISKQNDFKAFLMKYLKETSTELIFFNLERLHLRSDALEILSTYLDNNENVDGVFSDFIISLNQDVEYEINEADFATNFPFEIYKISPNSKIFPSILVIRKSFFIEFLNQIDPKRALNYLNFQQFILGKNFQIEKLDTLLGSKRLDLQIDNFESSDKVIKNKWLFDALMKFYGKDIIRPISGKDLIALPLHFSNPHNDLVTVVVLSDLDEKKSYFNQTIETLKHQTHTNLEILECSSNKEFEVPIRNIFSRIASGKYLMFINSGDELFPNCIEVLVKILKDNPNYSYVYVDHFLSDNQTLVRNVDFSFEKLKRFNFVPCYILFNRAPFIMENYFDEFLPLNYSLWEFLLRIGKKKFYGTRCNQPLLKAVKKMDILENKNSYLDAKYKSKIVLKHRDLFTEMQLQWATSTASGENLFDNSKIPLGIIPNNVLLTKVLSNKSEVKEVKQRRKLLFVMYGWNDTGGGTICPKNTALELGRRGWDVSVFYASTKFEPSKQPYQLDVSQEENVKLFGLYNRPAPFSNPENPEQDISDPNIEKIFMELLEKTQPEIIHFHNLHGLCLSLPKIAKEKFKIPTIFTPYNYYLIDPNLYMFNSDFTIWKNTNFFENSDLVKRFPEKRQSYQKRLDFCKQLIYEYFDLFLAVSRRQKEIFYEFAGNRDNIIVVHQANQIVDELWENKNLEIEAKRRLPARLRIGYLGGVFPSKGVHNFVSAAQHFLPIDAEFHVYGFVVGQYRQILNHLDKKKIIIYHNNYSDKDLERIAKEIDIGICSSIYEDPAPLVLLEMNAMRLPVLGSKIGGIPDFVVDGVTGFLFEPNDVSSMVSAIRYCLLNTDVVGDIRQKIFPYYTFRAYIDHLEKIYLTMLNDGIKNPKDFELIITNKLYALPKVSDARFTHVGPLPNQIEDAFKHLGFELLKIHLKDEQDDYLTYLAEFKIPKEVTISSFFEEIEGIITEERMSDEKTLVHDKYTVKPTLSDTIDEEKVFELADLNNLVSENSIRSVLDEKQTELPKSFTSVEYQPELNVVWEGSQFVYHSLALINREHCSNLIDTNLVEVTIIPYETEQFQPIGNPKYEKLAKKDIRIKDEPPDWVKKLPYLWIRHQWPPKADPPKGAKWVIIQPWEFTTLPKRFVDIFLQADELWVPSNFTRQAYINSGIPFNKVQVVPNGVDPNLFQPNGRVFELQTKKKLKFLYVGGTTFRKGFDVLLQSYVSAFTSKDDVVLVVKDMGTESVYRGQTSEEMINAVINTPGSPEIIYIKEYLTEEEMASLYRACDVFVSPYRGEGFSLPALEAMASGLPVIVTEGGATEDFVLESFAWKVPSYKISIGTMIDNDPLVGEAFLLEPDGDFLSSLLRAIYQNPADITVKGILASSYARSFWTWKRSTLKLLSRIDALYGKELSKKAKDILVDQIDAQILLGKAEEYFASGELAEAFRILKKVEENLDELCLKYRVFALLRLAVIHILNKDFHSASIYLTRVEELSDKNIDSLYLRSKMLHLQNKLVDALENYTELVSRWNSERFYSVIGNSLDQILTEMGEIMLDMRDIEKALQLFTNAIKLNQRNVEAHIGSARCFQDVGDFEEARRMLEWALKIDVDNQEAKELLKRLEAEKLDIP